MFGTKSLQCYEKVRQVGQGTYGKVYEGLDRESLETVALKKIKGNPMKRYNGVPSQIIREIRILKQYKHKNLVNLIDVVTSARSGGKDCDNGAIYLVFEYFNFDLGGLMDIKYNFTGEEIKCFMKQLLEAMEYLHSQQICHRDIKCSNILISPNHVLKVTDFGLARLMNTLDGTGRYTNKVITLWYRPPELLLGDVHYGTSVDMWSVGCIFLELLIRTPLIQGKSEIEQLRRIFDLCGYPSEDSWPGISKLPDFSLIEAFRNPSSKENRSMKRAWRQPKPPPGRLERFMDDHPVICKDARSIALGLLQLDPSMRPSAGHVLSSAYIEDALPPNMLPPMTISGTVHEWDSKTRRRLGDAIVAPPQLESTQKQRSSTPEEQTRESMQRHNSYASSSVGVSDREYNPPNPEKSQLRHNSRSYDENDDDDDPGFKRPSNTSSHRSRHRRDDDQDDHRRDRYHSHSRSVERDGRNRQGTSRRGGSYESGHRDRDDRYYDDKERSSRRDRYSEDGGDRRDRQDRYYEGGERRDRKDRYYDDGGRRERHHDRYYEDNDRKDRDRHYEDDRGGRDRHHNNDKRKDRRDRYYEEGESSERRRDRDEKSRYDRRYESEDRRSDYHGGERDKNKDGRSRDYDTERDRSDRNHSREHYRDDRNRDNRDRNYRRQDRKDNDKRSHSRDYRSDRNDDRSKDRGGSRRGNGERDHKH